MCLAVIAQVVDDVRRIGQQDIHARLFAVQHPQRIPLDALFVEVAQLVQVLR